MNKISMDDALWALDYDDYGLSTVRIYEKHYKLPLNERMSEMNDILHAIEQELS